MEARLQLGIVRKMRIGKVVTTNSPGYRGRLSLPAIPTQSGYALSKLAFISGLQCSKPLWHMVNAADQLLSPADSQANFDQATP